jgi:hypothetical protein
MRAQGEIDFDDEFSLGELCEVKVADSKGNLLAEKLDASNGAFPSHTCNGQMPDQVGIHFFPWSKLEYGPRGRIFFVCTALKIPYPTNVDPSLQLFCYDTVTKTVSGLLPLDLSYYISKMPAYQFSLSHDGRKVLLPLEKNRFMIYELGTTSAELPVEENEGFGENEIMKIAPAWKGKNEIACMVAEKSHFLKNEKDHGKEIVVLNGDGKFQRVLSENWPEVK